MCDMMQSDDSNWSNRLNVFILFADIREMRKREKNE